ncbi:MAG TPA: carboxypeptidase-like regulatory domain-containing protein, partial [Candidatus Hydrogenedentes bacterium]|nr:carboxypeptidase-like regulatory domain-containing protein [Candidatus Hydrogenedentota bacterium]
DQASRAPVPGTKVAATVDTTLTYYVTDARGMCAIPLPDGGPHSLITLAFTADGYVPVVWEWRAGVRPAPAEHTVLLEPGTAIGGVVLHAGEEPVRGATVLVTLPVTESAGNQVLVRDHAVQTGDDGAWRCGIVPAGLTSVYLRVEAPELSVQQNFQYGEGGRPLAPLRNFSDRLVLEERCILYGAVVTPEGQPVAGAAVAVWPTDAPWNSARLAATDGWGRFRVTGCPPRKSTILVRANGWAPVLDYADLLSGVATRELVAERGKPLRVRVVDSAGEPLRGAWIRVQAWRGLEGLLDWQAFADASGEAVWEDAPAEGISLAAEVAGAAPGSVKIPRLKDETYTIRIAAAVRIHGRVLKENDGAPVAAFAVTPGMAARNADGIRWLSSRR